MLAAACVAAHDARRMEFRYDFGAKLFVAILLLLVISDQLTSPSPDPRDAAPPQPSAERKLLEPAGGVDMRRAVLEEASLLLKLADRAIPYANAPLVEAAAALGVAPSDTPQMELSPPRRRPRRTPRSDASPEAEPPHPAAHVAEPAVAAGRSVRPAAAAAAVTDDPTCHTAAHTGYSGDRAVVWGLGKPGFHLNTSAECCDACKVLRCCRRRLPADHPLPYIPQSRHCPRRRPARTPGTRRDLQPEGRGQQGMVAGATRDEVWREPAVQHVVRPRSTSRLSAAAHSLSPHAAHTHARAGRTARRSAALPSTSTSTPSASAGSSTRR